MLTSLALAALAPSPGRRWWASRTRVPRPSGPKSPRRHPIIVRWKTVTSAPAI